MIMTNLYNSQSKWLNVMANPWWYLRVKQALQYWLLSNPSCIHVSTYLLTMVYFGASSVNLGSFYVVRFCFRGMGLDLFRSIREVRWTKGHAIGGSKYSEFVELTVAFSWWSFDKCKNPPASFVFYYYYILFWKEQHAKHKCLRSFVFFGGLF